jgi:FtsP/CotA-like multicopper oxidase with cupredoxin domain
MPHKMIKNFLSAFVLLIVPLCLQANKVTQNLFINRGILTTVKNTTFPFLAFNPTNTFTAVNAVISCLKNDTLVINVTNNDTAVHGFKVKNYPGISYTINPAASISCTLIPFQRSIFTYYDHLYYPKNTYMGLAGMIAVKDKANDKVYYWNLKEHFTTFNQQLGYGVNWANYYPDYFTINGKSYVQIQLDPTAKIVNQVNDTIYIYVQNTGRSMHSLHFHGFHPQSIFTDCKKIQPNWSKDTWGLFSMDAVVLRMIPDKTGKYSVHDHNLVAVTGGNTHPNGMFTIMQINP